ncbi:S8 family serine peptidase [Puniceicoccaceae bacterium K14]|nr:S8 family serine peptidase [Puniceicoccaceae bacterium K14]
MKVSPIRTLIPLSILIAIVSIWQNTLIDNPSTTSSSNSYDDKIKQTSEKADPSNSPIKTLSDALLETKPSSKENAKTPPWKWNNATVLDQQIKPTTEDSSVLLRKRIVTVPDLPNPILIEDLIPKGNDSTEPIHLRAIVANQLLISNTNESDESILASAATSIGWRILKPNRPSPVVVFQIDTPTIDSLDTALELLNDQFGSRSNILVEPNPIYYASTVIPNDLKFTQQHLWALDSGDTDINAPEAWEIATNASDQIVAVIDSGIRLDHEDLTENLWKNQNEIPGNGIDDDLNGYIDDVYGINIINPSLEPNDDSGHGTHVAGIIGAVGNNRRGTAGVLWDTNLLNLKFLSAEGRGDALGAIECIYYAIAVNASVINASWGGGPESYNQALENAIAQAADANIVFVAASGNDGRNTNNRPNYPSSYNLPNVISVGSIDQTGEVSSFSNRGSKSVDLFAPGGEILSAYNRYPSDYHTISGTSMAAPFVTGAAALGKAVFPNETLDTRVGRILFSIRQDDRLASQCSTGGALDLHKLLTTTSVPLPLTLTAISPEEIFIPEGEDLELEFLVSSDSPYSIQWKHNGETIQSEEIQKLKIFDISTLDAGQYIAKVSNADHSRSISFSVITGTPDPLIAEALDSVDSEFYNFEPGFWKKEDDPESLGGSHLTYNTTNATKPFQFATKIQGPATTRFWLKYNNLNTYDKLPLSFPNSSNYGGTIGIGENGWKLVETNFPDDGEQWIFWTAQIRIPEIYTSLEVAEIDNFKTYPIGEVPPVIINQPESIEVTLGTQTKFEATTHGPEPIYQWYFNSVEIEGEKSRTLIIDDTLYSDEGEYYVKVSNPWGHDSSQKATLSINDIEVGAFFTTEEPNLPINVDTGQSIALEFEAGGTPPMTYQWYKDRIPLPEIDGPSLEIYSARPEHNGEYTLEISNPYSTEVLSRKVYLTVNPSELIPGFGVSIPGSELPIYATIGIPTHPIYPGDFSASDPKYQWFKEGVPVPGAISEYLTLDSPTLEDSGNYYLEVSNQYGRALGPIREVIVTVPISEAFGEPGLTINTNHNGNLVIGEASSEFEGNAAVLIDPSNSSLRFPSNWVSLEILKPQESFSFWARSENPSSTPISSNFPISVVDTEEDWTKYQIEIEESSSEKTLIHVGLSSKDNRVWLDRGKWENNLPQNASNSLLPKGQTTVFTKESVQNEAGKINQPLVTQNVYLPESEEIDYSAALDYPNVQVVETLETLVDSETKYYGNESLLINGPIFVIQMEEYSAGVNYAIWLNTSASSVEVLGVNGIPETIQLDAGWNRILFQPYEGGYADFYFEGEETISWIDYLHIDKDLTAAINTRYFGTFLGDSVQFTAASSGGDTVTYQWLKDGIELRGQTSNTISFRSVSEDDFASYTIQISNGTETIMSEETQLFSTKEFGRAIESPLSRIRTWGESPWAIDRNVSTNGQKSIRSGQIGSSHLEIISTTGGLRAYYALAERTDNPSSAYWNIVTAVDLYNEDTIKITNSTPDLIQWIDRLSEQPFPATSYEQWLPQTSPANESPQNLSTIENLVNRNADTDSDGLSHFQEYVFGLDPLKADRPFDVSIEERTDGSYMRFSLKLVQGSDYQFKLEHSHNLEDWKYVSTSQSSEDVISDELYRTLHFEHPIEPSNSLKHFYKYTIVPLASQIESIGITQSDN